MDRLQKVYRQTLIRKRKGWINEDITSRFLLSWVDKKTAMIPKVFVDELENEYGEYFDIESKNMRILVTEAVKRKAVSDTLKVKVWRRDGHTCQYCGESGGNLTIDHWIPVSKGGPHVIHNLLTSCMKCNEKKGANLVLFPTRHAKRRIKGAR